MMITAFLHNMTLIVTITFVFIRLRDFFVKYPARLQFWFTSLFVGLFSIAIMQEQFHLEGYLVDLRSLPLILISYLGGWKLGLVAALFPGLYRYYQGGADVEAAIAATVLLPIAIGAVFHKKGNRYTVKTIPILSTALIGLIYFICSFILGALSTQMDIPYWAKISASFTVIGIISMIIMLVMMNTSIRKNIAELQLEQAVIEREAILQSASEVSIISTDLRGIITSFNRGSEKMLGYSAEELIGKHSPATIHLPQEVEARSKELSKAYNERIEGLDVFVYLCKKGQPETRLWTYVRKDGITLTVRLSNSAIYDYKGNITGYLGVGHEMTKEIELRAELNEQNELLEAQNEEIVSQQDELQETLMKIQNHRDLIERIIESNHEGIVLSNESGIIQYANQRMKDYFGFKPETGKSIVSCCKEMSASIVGNDAQIPDKVIRILHGELGEFKEKFIFQDRSGEKLHFEIFGTSIRNKSNTQREYLFIFYNQTAQVELDEMKDDLISVISHELRTPMASILGFVEILLNREVPKEKQRKYMEIVYKETNRLTNLLNDFLDIQRMESARQEYQFSLIDLTTIVSDVVEQWQNKPTAIQLSMPEEEVLIEGDVQKLTQVLHNLISNAVKYSPGAAKIDIQLGTRHDEIWVQVKDYGLGIPEKDVARLFTKFFRVEHSDRMQIGGTGLGLSICREIMKAHQGEISVQSIWGEGSSFTIHLKRPQQELFTANQPIFPL
jgi:PAS domain S-box-containing protein